jgi:hypothetical protein
MDVPKAVTMVPERRIPSLPGPYWRAGNRPGLRLWVEALQIFARTDDVTPSLWFADQGGQVMPVMVSVVKSKTI